MLRIFYRLKEMDFGKLMELYSEGNRDNAEQQYPQEDVNIGILLVEQNFYQYLNEVFFPTEGAFYAVWLEEGRYISALRMEPYRDGYLLEALETHPNYRRKGFAKALITAILRQFGCTDTSSVYAHVHKGNDASLKTHLACGFTRISEQTVYIDGSVNSRCCTLQYRF